ncbi:MAG TPA: universal stress protein [Longimicrobium sp.]|nr:universal stress protein [Longimicrobium sp.]
MLPLETILAATDLTDACDEVLRAAAGLARRTGAALHVIHSFDFPPAPYFDVPPDAINFQSRIDDSEAAMDAQIARVVPPDVAVAGRRLEVFAAARAIADYAAAIHASLLVMGPHTRRRLEAGFLGTTADRVIRTVEIPVLIVRGELRLPLRRVLVPVDLSERTGCVLDVALRWGMGLGASDGMLPVPGVEMEIIHVVPRVLAPPGLPFDRATVRPGINQHVEAAVARAGGASAVQVSEEVLWGDRPDREIVRYAREAGSDLLVMATHGYGMVRRALIGSTASGVTRAVHCPVLLLPPAVWRAAPAPMDEVAHASAG